MSQEEEKLVVTLIGGDTFEMEPDAGRDLRRQAISILEGERVATETHENGAVTLHSTRVIANISIGRPPRGKTTMVRMGVP